MSNAKRNTQQRTAIEAVFANSIRPLTPQDVHAAARKVCPGLGIATVYRAIRDLIEEAHIRAVTIPEHPPLYERTDLDHHHHFQCKTCGEVTPLQGCSLDHDYTLPDGFRATHHEVIFSGTCAACTSS